MRMKIYKYIIKIKQVSFVKLTKKFNRNNFIGPIYFNDRTLFSKREAVWPSVQSITMGRISF